METFVGQSGEAWRFDDRAIIGDESGMGTVFRGLSSDGKIVAVKKVVLPGGQDSLTSRTNREIAIGIAIDGIDSEHVVKALDWAETQSEILIVMPMADRSLAQAITAGDLNEATKTMVIKHVSLGLVGLAEASIIYRDLKPANVLEFDGKWKLADFGISRNLNEATGTMTYARYGTPAYMAPELWNGGIHSVKTDLYALGVLSWEIFMGALPHIGPSNEDYARQHQFDEPPEVVTSSVGMKTLIRRLLSKEPHSRPQDARSVVEELARLDQPLPPELESLRVAVADHQERRSEAEILTAQTRAREAARLAVLAQGKEELKHILETGCDGIGLVIPGVSFVANQDWLRISSDQGMLQASYWHFPPVPPLEDGDPLIMAGAIYTNLSAANPAANLVYELLQGRYVWSVLRFTSNSMVGNNYSLGPVGIRHGFNHGDFWRERYYMVHYATHIWTMEKRVLDVGSIQQLFEEAIRNSIA